MEDTDDEDFAGQSSAERIIRLNGDISDETTEKFLLNLHRVAETPGEIIVIISSDGGDIEDGLSIIDALAIAKSKGCPIHTVVTARAYSMAAYIACCGDTRTIYKHARLMFHPGRYDGSDGELTASELRSMYSEISKYDDVFREILGRFSVPGAMINEMLTRDVYLGSREALSYGIMDDIEKAVI